MPLLHWFRRRGLSQGFAFAAVILIVLVPSLALLVLAAIGLAGLVQAIPDYQEELSARVDELSSTLMQQGIDPVLGLAPGSHRRLTQCPADSSDQGDSAGKLCGDTLAGPGHQFGTGGLKRAVRYWVTSRRPGT